MEKSANAQVLQGKAESRERGNKYTKTASEQYSAYQDYAQHEQGLRRGVSVLQSSKCRGGGYKYFDKHLTIRLKEEKRNNKTSQKHLEKFNQLLDEKNYGGGKDD